MAKKNLDGMAKNFEVVIEQWGDYKAEVRDVVIPGIVEAEWKRKPHKCQAFIEEWYDKMPRLQSYTLLIRFPVAIFLWWSLLT